MELYSDVWLKLEAASLGGTVEGAVCVSSSTEVLSSGEGTIGAGAEVKS